ncbi:unnamed protein product [Adineta steineri]|uniref:Glycosyl hydrolase family 13 catalytic domain-containing protein n=1 Tax=Adineta steineri TaxID=433720 RepID=A0A815EYX4_9BILA|nr:unnamed protein product [Adineta steineri]CAF1580843.1 unnamed protein product [Adineta steineri]
MVSNKEEDSSIITIEELFSLVPIEKLNENDLKKFSFNLNSIKSLSHINKNLIESINKCDLYHEGIINEDLFSFYRSNKNEAYLIVIAKDSSNNKSFIRYTFSKLFHDYQIGQLKFSTKNSFYKSNQFIDLSFVQLFLNQAYVFKLDYLSSNYIDSLHWWKKGLIYQIIPSSFQDSNNDGFGDLNGLIQRLDYIQQLGVKTIWLTPIYKSKFRDLGYDISDYCSIDPRFGTLDDFKTLINEIHNRQMRLMVDFVPNHCSIEHPWFQSALKNEKPYVDYFIWHSGKNKDSKIPPTNWIGYAGQSMWTWSPERNQWYLHQFMDCQPDLNFRNENVCQEIENVMKFWLDLGVDGFRADATKHLIENDQFKDEPLKENDQHDDLQVEYEAYEHTETSNQPDTYKIITRWRRFLDEYITNNKRDYIILITETQDKDVDSDMKYYGPNRWSRGNDMAINFFLAYFLGENPENRTGEKLSKFIQSWLEKLPNECWTTWTMSSHDSKRVATKLASSNLIDGFYMLLLFLPGTPILYYGEEIGMENLQYTKEIRHEINDLSAFNYGINDENKIEEKTRDGQRTPMQWNSDEINAGFTNATKPYHPLSKSWKTINVQNQLNSNRSHLKLFKQLVQLRQNEPFYSGKFQLILADKYIYSFIRWSSELETAPIYLIIINMFGAGQNDREDQHINLDFIKLLKCKNKNAKGKVIARSTNIKDNSSLSSEGNQVDLNDICLYSSESVLLQLLLNIHEIDLSST